jgi:iron complex outermembrane receptor protein
MPGCRSFALVLLVSTGALAELDPPPGPAQPSANEIGALDLGELLDLPVTAASRREQRSNDAPASVFVLGAEDLDRQGFRSIAEALASVPGLFTSADPLYTFVGVRGLSLLDDYSTRVLVLLDGHALNNSTLTNTFFSGELPVDLGALERIEVIQGPVGGVYGPTAFFAVVNLVTKAAAGGRVRVSGDVGIDGGRGVGASLSTGGKLLGAEIFLHASASRSAGQDWTWPQLAQDPRGPASGRIAGQDGELAQRLYLRATRGELSLSAGWVLRYKADPSGSYASTLGDGRNFFGNRIAFADLSWTHHLSDHAELLLRAAYDEAYALDRLIYPDPPAGTGPFLDDFHERWGSGELRLVLRPLAQMRVTVGAEAQLHHTRMESRAPAVPSLQADPVNGLGVDPIENTFRTLNAYLLLEQGIGEALTLQAGLTGYTNSLFESSVTPKLAAVWHPGSRETLKLSFSRGIRPASVGEGDYQDGTAYVANPALGSEHVSGLDASWEHHFGAAAAVTLTGFRNTYDGMVRFVSVPAPGLGREPDPATPSDYRLQPQNAGSTTVAGAQLSFVLRLPPWLRGWGGISLQRTDLAADAPERGGFAPATATLALSGSLPGFPATLALRGLWTAPRGKALNGLQTGERTEVPAALVLSASLRAQLPWVSGLAAQLSVTDLLDSRPPDPLPTDFAPLTERPGPGRSARLAAELSF